MLSFIRCCVSHYRFKQSSAFLKRNIQNCTFFSRITYRKMSQDPEVPEDFAEFDCTISLADPLKDYQKFMDTKLNCDMELPGHMYIEIWDKISEAACDAVWRLMFDTEEPTKDHMDKAAVLLKQFKDDASFQNPTGYNKWIYKFRDELLKRKQIEFWKNVVVAKELGPAWARDSDMFDRFDDPEPAKFYKHAGCEAPWLKEEAQKPTVSPLNLMVNTSAADTSEIPKCLKKITKENALEDYKHNMLAQKDIDYDDEDSYKKIFAEVREILWQLLFSESSLSAEKSKMAAALLQEYKLDACFFSPYDYNEWIPKVRDELLKRKCFDFWQIIVNERLGLCCAKDSDYFDDMEDPKPMEFYKSGDELMKQDKK